MNRQAACPGTTLILLLATVVQSTFCIGNYFQPGSRSSALSSSSVCLSDVWSSFNNQAGLALLDRPSAGLFFENKYLTEAFQSQALALAVPLKPGVIGISAAHFGYSLFSENKAGISISRNFSNRFSSSLQFDYFQQNMGEGYGIYRNFALEIGLLGNLSEEISLGIHVFNPIPFKPDDASEFQMPTIGRVGLKYAMSKVHLMGETEINTLEETIFKVGVEVEAVKNIFLRGGYATQYDQYSFGMGYGWKGWSIDLAFSKHPVLGFSPNIALGYAF